MKNSLAFAPRLVQTRLENGLGVVLLPDRSRPLTAINLWYHVGSKNERPGRTGFAHLFEHMLFQGSQNVGTNDHFALIQQVGGVANGSTSYDRTNYYETLPSHCLELGLWLEADRMGFLLPALDEVKLQNQKDVVMNERRQRVDNQPYGRAFETLHELLYPEGHPYRWPVIGYMDDIAATTLPEVHAFFAAHYAPRNAVLTLVGDFEPSEALELIERYFADLPGGSQAPPLSADAKRALEQPTPAQRHELRDAVKLPRLYLAWRGPALTASEWPVGDLHSTAVSHGKSSPLYREFVLEREIAQDVYLGMVPLELESTVVAAMTLRPGVDPATAEAALLERLESFRSSPPRPEDFERARNKTLVGLLHEVESFESRADLLSAFATHYGDAARIDGELERYLAVTPDQLTSFASRYHDPEQAVTLWVLPEEAS